MKKYLLGAWIALLLALAVPASGLAADAWLLDTSVAGAPKAKVTATLTYTDGGRSVTVKYKPLAARVRIERNVDLVPSRHTTSVQLTQGTDVSANLAAGMEGSGLKAGNSTSIVAGINLDTDVDTPFVFSDNAPGFHSMAAANVMASSAEGKYDEVVDKTSGLPAGPINLSLTFTIVGNLDTGQPARIVVQVSAKNVQPETTP